MSRCTRTVDNDVMDCKGWANEQEQQCEERGHWDCKGYVDQGYADCNGYVDQGYAQCGEWGEECADWLPSWLGWVCDAIEWVCQAWYWVTHWVCQAWYWVTHWVCLGWNWVVEEVVCPGVFWLVGAGCTFWGWIGKAGCWIGTKVRCFARALTGGRRRMPRIRHVFVLMLENRSFDHMLGFSDIKGRDPVTGEQTSVDGLSEPAPRKNSHGAKVWEARKDAAFSLFELDEDPGHEFDDVLTQLCGLNPDGTLREYKPEEGYPPIDNSGFASSYLLKNEKPGKDPANVMKCYSREQLPVLTTLADEFAVCDRWFSSMPGPTWPNRYFVHAASSGGLDDSPKTFDVISSALVDGFRFEHGTIFDALDDACLDFEIFEGDETPQVFAISGMNLYALEGKFTDFEDFKDRLQEKDYSPSYIFIEPDYGNLIPLRGVPDEIPVYTAGDYTCGNSQHPLDDVTRGERLIKRVYETIRNSPHWERSVLVITYDEHGGFYDHVPPPKTVAPGDRISDEDNNQHNFDFTQLGVRVPAVIVSPLIPRGTIDHYTEYDHSSISATIERLFGLRPLTMRDAGAKDFLHLLSLGTPRPDSDCPNTLPEPADSGFRCVPTTTQEVTIPSEAEKVDTSPVGTMSQAQKAVISPTVRGFMHVAMLKDLSLIPRTERAARRDLVKQFLLYELRRRQNDIFTQYGRECVRRKGRPSGQSALNRCQKRDRSCGTG